MRAARLFFLILGVFALLVLAAGLVLAWAEMDMRVVATGTVEPASEVYITSRITGVVKELYKKLYDEVNEGEPIALIDDTAAREQLLKARSELDSAGKRLDALELERRRIQERIRNLEIRLEELEVERGRARERLETSDAVIARRTAELADAKEAVQQAAIREENAESQAEEYRQLGASGFVTERRCKDAEAAARIAAIDTERARLRVEALAAELKRARSQREDARMALEAITETRIKADIEEARFDLQSVDVQVRWLAPEREKLEADVRLAQLRLEDHIIRAPVAGRIERLYMVEGQEAGVGAPPEFADAVGTIVEDSGFIFSADLLQKDVVRVKPDQKVEVVLDTYPYRRYGMFMGRVTDLERRVDEPEKYTVYIKLNKPIYPLKPGMRGYARIIVGRVRVLTYLMGQAEPKDIERLRKKAVEVGSATYPEEDTTRSEPTGGTGTHEGSGGGEDEDASPGASGPVGNPD